MCTKRSSAIAVVGAMLAAGVIAAAQDALDVVKVRDNVYMIAGAGSNVTVQFGSDGAVVVDAGTQAQADAVVAAIRKITPQPIRYVIDTSDDADHVGGNEKVAKAGRTLFQTNNAFGRVIGLGSAFGLARLVASLLFGVKAWDPAVFVSVPIVLALVALAAVWLPAMRASRVDPIVALREA